MLSRSCSEDVILAKAMNLSANDHHLGCLDAMNAMNAMKDHCNTICVHKSTPLLPTFKLSFSLFQLLLEEQCFHMLNPCPLRFLTK
jgi:hypothetical protein